MKAFLPLIALLIGSAPAYAEPTQVKVHAISEDAKFIGDSMGGVEIILRDAATGKRLAKGITAGGTGDTGKIMNAIGRSPARITPDAAYFAATLDIIVPTLVRVELRGPLARPLTMQRATSERWLIPGDAADKWVFELPGLAILVDGATAMTKDRATMLTAKVSLMCGCPITPGGLWDAADYEVIAELRRKHAPAERVALDFSASPGVFTGRIVPRFAGAATLWISARNRRTGNSGAAHVAIRIEKP